MNGRRLASAALVAAMVSVVGLAAAQTPADRPATPIPAAKKKELLETAPFDRITLLDDTVWEVEPLAPRPFALYDPRKKKNTGVMTAEDVIREGGNITARGVAQPKLVTPDTDAEPPILIHMIEGDIRDYHVRHEHIKAVEHFEDMLLAEADRLIQRQEFTKAFEYLLYVSSRAPEWKGLSDRLDRVQFEEGSSALLDGDGDRGLRLLGDLQARRPDYPGLADKLVGSYASRVAKAYGLGAFAKGRQVLRDLERLAPDHLLTREARERFVAGAKALATRAENETDPGRRVDDLSAAARIWPTLEGLSERYAEAFRVEPTLEVAVADLPRPIAPRLDSTASARVVRLLYRPIFADTSDAAIAGTAPGQLAVNFETFDLARGLRIRLRTDLQWSDGSRPVSAIDVARALADRAVPTAPGYSARWGDLLQKVEVVEDDLVEVRLARTCLQPQAWLLDPVGPAHAGWDGRVSIVGKGRRPVGDGGFAWESSNKDVDLYRSIGRSPIRRLREIRFASPTAAVAAFVRGEATLIESVPIDRVAEIAAVPGVQVGKYDRPSLHRIALDGRNPVLGLRSLRRGLSLALDRSTLLTETILRGPVDEVNNVSDGPFLRGTPADAADVPPLTYDPLLAKMLVTAAKAESGAGIIRLTFEYPPIAEVKAIVPRLLEAWKLAGLDIVPKEVPRAELEARLRAGGRFDLAYLVSRPGEPTRDAPLMICPAYDAPPSSDPLASVVSPRIRGLLLELDRASDITTARDLAVRIDRESRDELPAIPLWQIQEHYAWRERLRGVPAVTRSLYDGIESWEIAPWIAEDMK
ncbi:MAG: ABC transporter substrate-binding protein [Isosphaeraceae bacterium]|nr:ABC transporter substrate-binding protein [Isosphaeraceae bacterium]